MRPFALRSLLPSVVLGSCLWTAPPAAAQGPTDAEVARAQTALVREKLADDVYLFRAPSDLDYWTSTNSVVILGDDDVTVFDSSTRAVTARAVIAEIRKLSVKPVRTLINSHWHMDHWSGNGEYARAFPGLRIVATAETRDYMSRMGPRFFADEAGVDRQREALESAIRTGRLADGSPLTEAVRHAKEASLAEATAFAAEVEALPRVLPDLVFRDELTFWSGKRELRLSTATGDATGSAVLYLPRERILVTGDLLVRPESGDGPPPWTTNSYAISPWLASLRRLAALDAAVIVPGQGPAMRDGAYLRLTIDLFAAILDQVHAALERGLFTLTDVQAAVDVSAIGRQYSPGAEAPDPRFRDLVATLIKKALQESVDGAANLK
jgi:glyoxylase-like metal-dependent hydrolase (beta-lactamase superfamily II)